MSLPLFATVPRPSPPRTPNPTCVRCQTPPQKPCFSEYLGFWIRLSPAPPPPYLCAYYWLKDLLTRQKRTDTEVGQGMAVVDQTLEDVYGLGPASSLLLFPLPEAATATSEPPIHLCSHPLCPFGRGMAGSTDLETTDIQSISVCLLDLLQR